MKLRASENFYCRVRLCKQEELEHPQSDLFSDMYLLVLQTLVNVAFVPNIDRDNNHLPPKLKPYDEIATPLDARLYVLHYNTYTVTPDDSRVGVVESYTMKDWIFENKIFYVSEKDYCKYVNQIMRMYVLDIGGNPAGIRVNDLKQTELISFLKETIIPNMQASHRDFLRPERGSGRKT